ncbi:histidine phosphatase family protein [uncultured Bosea sp.]|uniref:histidine phosphatase family protein n=1 Tax=uncultured Bosea sp. TaxID=211457 RepID=UPI0025DD67EA|nr:histidine phosphatase family protein [uncultured Bosea sp.]
MATVYFVTHPEVVVDPLVPVPDWGLSAIGWKRIEAFCQRPELADVTDVFTSDERKAMDCAEALQRAWGLPFTTREDLRENDRSATGYVAPPRFWEIVDQFFGQPDTSILGWETARAAQARIKVGVAACIAARRGTGDLMIFAHGGVGTLLLSDLRGEPISRKHGQPIAGGGCYFAFDMAGRALHHGWRDIVPEGAGAGS